MKALTPLPFSMSRPLASPSTWVAYGILLGYRLDLEILRIDSLVGGAASINLEKERKDKFSKKILYSSIMLWRHTSTNTSSATRSQQSMGLS